MFHGKGFKNSSPPPFFSFFLYFIFQVPLQFTRLRRLRRWHAVWWCPSMFWVLGPLHQEPRVGGTHGRVRRDGSDGWRSPVSRGDKCCGARLSAASANHRFPVPPTGCEHRDALWTVYQMAVPVHPDGFDVAASFLTRCRGSRDFRPCRCGDFGLVSRHRPAEHLFQMLPQLPMLRRRVVRVVAASVSFFVSLSHPPRCFPILARNFVHATNAMSRWRRGSTRPEKRPRRLLRDCLTSMQYGGPLHHCLHDETTYFERSSKCFEAVCKSWALWEVSSPLPEKKSYHGFRARDAGPAGPRCVVGARLHLRFLVGASMRSMSLELCPSFTFGSARTRCRCFRRRSLSL